MTDLFIMLLISTIGLGYFIYGKKAPDSHFLIAGIILMVYPYFLHGVLMIIAGVLLLIAPFLTKRYFGD